MATCGRGLESCPPSRGVLRLSLELKAHTDDALLEVHVLPRVDLDTAPFAVMWFLLGRDIAQQEALQEREAELLFGDG